MAKVPRLALELQEREERYAREQEEGAARHAELSQRRREEEVSDGEEDEGDRSQLLQVKKFFEEELKAAKRLH